MQISKWLCQYRINLNDERIAKGDALQIDKKNTTNISTNLMQSLIKSELIKKKLI